MDQGKQHQEAEERTRSICEARLAEVHKEAAALRAKVDKLEAQSVKVWAKDYRWNQREGAYIGSKSHIL